MVDGAYSQPCAQESLLEIFRGPCVLPGFRLWSTACKASALLVAGCFFFFLNELQFMKKINIDCLVFKMGMQCIYSENSLHTLMVGHLKVKHLTVIPSSPLPRLCLNYYSLVYVKYKFFLYSCLHLKYNSD